MRATKKFTVLSLAVIMLLTLAGCGDKSVSTLWAVEKRKRLIDVL